MSASESPRMQLLLYTPVGRMLYKLAAPNVAATLMMTAITFADAWFVGRLGTAALASLALVYPFLMLMQMMSGGAIGGGVASALSRALGRGDVQQAQAVAWHAVVITCFMALLFMIVLGLFSRPIFALLGGTGEALEGAVLYSQVAFGGAITVWLLWILSAVFRGAGDTVTPARAVLVSGAAQIALAGMLTLGLGPIPALGIVGLAIAMVLCQGLAVLYLALILIQGRTAVRLYPQMIRWRPIADIMRVGGLGLINSTGIAATVVVVTGLVGRYGTEALAGYGLGSRLELMLIPIAFGIGGALTVGVGANVGAGQFARARRIAWTGGITTFVITGIIGVVVAFMPGLWLDLFTADEKAYGFGAQYLAIVAPLYGFFGGGQALYFASQGTGRMLLPVSVGVIRLLVVTAIGSLAVFLSWQVNAVFIAVGIGLLVIGGGLGACMYSAAWRPAIQTSDR